MFRKYSFLSEESIAGLSQMLISRRQALVPGGLHAIFIIVFLIRSSRTLQIFWRPVIQSYHGVVPGDQKEGFP